MKDSVSYKLDDVKYFVVDKAEDAKDFVKDKVLDAKYIIADKASDVKDLVENAAYYVTDKASDTKNFIVDKAIDTKDFDSLEISCSVSLKNSDSYYSDVRIKLGDKSKLQTYDKLLREVNKYE
ncbi:hypothetical protein [Peribacillus butanolivorans]|uniref:hypothetical protein n=1 Tax=Peribacillus butanolivorans TaxID=421767 RepID=UPI00167FB9FD|nr:hypothetical protein [Peribacillus butanolivorans]QNU04754.1 hypothetical protein GM240_12925 [Peribacillus butanolivorans]